MADDVPASILLWHEGPFRAAPHDHPDDQQLFFIDFHLYIVESVMRSGGAAVQRNLIFHEFQRCSVYDLLPSLLDWMEHPLEDAGMDPTLIQEVLSNTIRLAASLWSRRDGDYRVNLHVEIIDHQEIPELKRIRIEEEDPDLCPICLVKLSKGEEVSCTPCSHLFHVDCIGEWLKNNLTCPNCRRSLFP